MSIKTRTSGIMVDINVEPAASTTTTWDPAKTQTTAGGTLSNGNLTYTANADITLGCTLSLAGVAAGKVYWEVHTDAAPSGGELAGIAQDTHTLNQFLGQAANADSLGIDRDGNVFYNATINTLHAALAIAWGTGTHTLCFAVDRGANKFWIRVDGGNWNGDVIANENPATGAGGIDISGISGIHYAAVNLDTAGQAVTANFGGSVYAQTAPVGYGNF